MLSHPDTLYSQTPLVSRQNVCPKRDSPDDIHSAVENENTVFAYFTSNIYIHASLLDGTGHCRHPKFDVVLYRGAGVFQVI